MSLSSIHINSNNEYDYIFDNNFALYNKHKISIAPMIDITTPYFRYLMRLITNCSVLYTDMINANTILMSKKGFEKELYYHNIEHPIVVQLGGNNPDTLGEAAKYCKLMGYDEINLNCGCPSGKVMNSNFGACLMKNPNLVYECCKSIKKNSNIETTIKCRLGVDTYNKELLNNFISESSTSFNYNIYKGMYNNSTIDIEKKFKNSIFNFNDNKNLDIIFNKSYYNELTVDRKTICELSRIVKHFIIHSRIAIQGLDTIKNRKIPPLMYNEVYNLKSEFSNLHFSINGGVKSKKQAIEIFKESKNTIIGIMIGRAAYDNPFLFSDFDSTFYNKKDNGYDRETILYKYIDYIDDIKYKLDVPKHEVINPLYNLFTGEKFNTTFKNLLSDCKNYKNEDITDHLKLVIDKYKKINSLAFSKLTIYDK